MKNQLSIGDRLLVETSDFGSLTDFYLKGISENEYEVEFGYGIISGFTTYPKSKVKKHPIQRSQFTFSISISGNECNSENPKLNDFSKYLLKMNNHALITRTATICLREIGNSFSDKESKNNVIVDLVDILLNSDDCMNSLNSWIVPIIEDFPEDFSCMSVLEYNGENAPPIAMYNSERRNNNVVTAIFLVLYCIIMSEIGALTKNTIIQEITKYIK